MISYPAVDLFWNLLFKKVVLNSDKNLMTA